MTTGKEWSHEDVDTLIRMYQEGESCKAISRRLRRSHTAVCYKLGKLSNLYREKTRNTYPMPCYDDDYEDERNDDDEVRGGVDSGDGDDENSDSTVITDSDVVESKDVEESSCTVQYFGVGFFMGGVVSVGMMSFFNILSKSLVNMQ